MAFTPDELRVRKGERISAAKHNALVSLAERLTLQRGRIPGRQSPDGFTPMVDVQATAAPSGHAWKITPEDQGETLALFFTPAHVSGIMPMIGKVPLDEVGADGRAPALIVTKDAWAKRGMGERALIMFRYELRHTDFRPEKIVPVAVATPPDRAPWTWHKLIAILTRFDGAVKVWPQCWFPQAFDATDTTPAGAFTPWPRAEG